jgi:hypothetical protein
MKCENYRKYFADYHMDRLGNTEKAELEHHLETCADCREALTATQMVLNRISGLPDPQPSANMKVNFRIMLDDFKAAEEKPVATQFGIRLKRFWALQPRFPLAYGLVVLLICAGVVYWLGRSNKQEEDMRDLHVLAMLDNPLASERIKAVNYTGEMKRVDKKVIAALFATLNNDPNDNVRLSTLEALAGLAGDPRVRAGLVQSITKQESPVVQIAIAEVMLKLQEKRSVLPLKELLKQQDLDSEVKDKVKETITKLI